MKTKICIGKWGCGEEKPLKEFTKASHLKDGYRNTCKSCNSERQRIWQQKNVNKKGSYSNRKEYYIKNSNKTHRSDRDGYHYLYYKPSENYIGITKNKYSREKWHNNKMIYLCRFTNRKDALITEAYLQKIYNYKGACMYTGKYAKLATFTHIRLANIIHRKIQ